MITPICRSILTIPPDTRLSEIVAAGLAAPPRSPTPPPAEEAEEAEEEEEVKVEVESSEPAADVIVTGIPETVYPKMGFSFVQESEIDDTQPADDSEWVDAGASTAEQALEEEDHVEREATPEPRVQERVAPIVVEEPTTGASIDWATDETELPPITSIHESFGMAPPAEVRTESAPEATNGRPPRQFHRRPHHDEEGFTHPRGGRGRGRGFRGDRGGGHRGFRGGERGGGRGGFRGGEGGGFRSGEGGFRGGEGGFRSEGGGFRSGEGGYRGGEGGGYREGGGFRGGEGGYRGGENGGVRGGPEGDSPRTPEGGGFRGGEGRGGYRGRGEGRGGMMVEFTNQFHTNLF